MKRSLPRTIGHWIMVGFAAWLLLTGLFAWVTVDGQTVGIFQALNRGLPAWHLLVPAYGALSLYLLFTRRPGTYWHLFIGNFVFTFAVGLPLVAGWQSLEARTGLEVTIWSALIFALALGVSLVSIFMAVGEAIR